MTQRKDKSLAALLAFIGGIAGLHRFYLGQTKTGVFMILLSVFTFGMLSSLIGLIDSIVFFTMDDEIFDLKYNKEENRRRTDAAYYKTKRRRKIRSEKPDFQRSQHRDFRQSGRSRRIKTTKVEKTKTEDKPKEAYKELLAKVEKYKAAGIAYFKEYDFEESIANFNKVLELDSGNVAAHFNIACAYSQIEDTTKAIFHLDKAVKNGFKDFDKIKKHEKLSLTRIQKEWESFEANGFQLEIENEEETNPLENTNSEGITEVDNGVNSFNEEKPNSDSLFENLKLLKEQREKGLISDSEFELQRRKLLS
ncbi:TM2 domain-containing protein [Membranihabitans marinus]|uniref:TM2 domain-containing protein n=1 Tax=Membranihabitans marinus TaxID=1227546 RepID=UPI001F2D5C30|nr:TM2 domain-containing protein [Membranihabitans marinus]